MTYIFFLAYKTIRAVVTLFFSIFFQSSFSDRKVIPFQAYLFINGLIFGYYLRDFFISSWFNATVTAYWKDLLYSLLMEFIVAFLLFIQSRESLHDPPKFGFIYDMSNTVNKHYSLTFIDFKLFWYLFFSESKSSFTTSSGWSLIMISMLSLFEWISPPSLSIEEIKLIEFSAYFISWNYLLYLLNMV